MKPEDYPIPANATEVQKKAWRDYLLKAKTVEARFLKAVDYLLKYGMPCDMGKRNE